MRASLSRFVEDMPLREQCSFFGCMHKEDHACESHRCTQCAAYGHQCTTTTTGVQCPTCRTTSAVELRSIYTGVACIVCMEEGPVVLFARCGHANVCATCVARLDE